jgi:hypothetical protein
LGMPAGSMAPKPRRPEAASGLGPRLPASMMPHNKCRRERGRTMSPAGRLLRRRRKASAIALGRTVAEIRHRHAVRTMEANRPAPPASPRRGAMKRQRHPDRPARRIGTEDGRHLACASPRCASESRLKPTWKPLG